MDFFKKGLSKLSAAAESAAAQAHAAAEQAIEKIDSGSEL